MLKKFTKKFLEISYRNLNKNDIKSLKFLINHNDLSQYLLLLIYNTTSRTVSLKHDTNKYLTVHPTFPKKICLNGTKIVIISKLKFGYAFYPYHI